jgi:hypothetical protein
MDVVWWRVASSWPRRQGLNASKQKGKTIPRKNETSNRSMNASLESIHQQDQASKQSRKGRGAEVRCFQFPSSSTLIFSSHHCSHLFDPFPRYLVIHPIQSNPNSIPPGVECKRTIQSSHSLHFDPIILFLLQANAMHHRPIERKFGSKETATSDSRYHRQKKEIVK